MTRRQGYCEEVVTVRALRMKSDHLIKLASKLMFQSRNQLRRKQHQVAPALKKELNGHKIKEAQANEALELELKSCHRTKDGM
jgi:hypothetical protein